MSATDTDQGDEQAGVPAFPTPQGVELPDQGAAAGESHLDAPEGDHAPAGDEASVVQSNPLRLVAVIAAIVALGVFVSWPAVIVVLSIVFMIFMHELGHYLTARRAGMLVTEFFIGFGPRIWSFRRGEVEYGLKAIPAGAYVRVVGMSNLDEVDPADEARTYRQQPFWQRFSVAVAGSTMHFIMAFVLLFVVYAGFGVPNQSEWTIAQITPSDSLVQNGEPVTSPAEAAGLRPGDRILAVDDTEIDEFLDLKDVIESQPGETVTLTVRRDGRTIETTATLLSQGPEGAEEGFLGVSPRSPRERLAPLAAVQRAGSEFASIATQSVTSLGRFFSPSGITNFVDQAVNAQDDANQQSDDADGTTPPPDENRIVSIYGAARIGTQATEAGIATLFMFLALLNIFIGVFNLVPLLPLDGGHVAIAIYEKIRERQLHLHQRYFADIHKLLPITYGVVLVLVTIGIMALYLDVANPINLPN